jgi:trk system potassium uptake protein
MKFIVFGLGNFGLSLAMKLTKLGHEVIGVDRSEDKVDLIKDSITHAVALDSTSVQAVKTLPIADADAVVVAIGEDEGASIMTTALLKQLKAKRIVGRAISPLHQTVLESMGVDELMHPEEDSAERLALKLDMKGVVESFALSDQYSIVEVRLPERYTGQTIMETNFRSKYNVNILTIIRTEEKINLIGIKRKKQKVLGVLAPDTQLIQGDILVIFGATQDIQKIMES